jgi:Domain of unknown function (DUF6901)
MSKQSADPLVYQYKFEFDRGLETNFEVRLDARTLQVAPDPNATRPSWTKLKFHQCENCPLPDSVEYCPVAVNLARIVEAFRDKVSFESTVVTVKTKERTFVKKTSLQKGISSIIGIYMTTSNCPILDKLRPMARFHLPFATSEETFFRSISTYLTAQLVLSQNGQEPDWKLSKLLKYYKEINLVNRGMSDRLAKASERDATVNAIVILHSFGDGISYFVDGGLKEFEPMFSVFLDDPEKASPATKTSDVPPGPAQTDH